MEPVKVYLALILIGVLYATCESAATEEYTGDDADSSLQPRGWNIQQARRTAPCGSHTLFPGQMVYIKSANYPRKYPPKHFCKWMFQVTTPDSTLTLTCNRFQLSRGKKSFLSVIAGSVKKRYLKKPSLPIAVTSSDNTMQVTFRSRSGGRRRRGFTCTVSASLGSCCANKKIVVDESFPVGTNDTFDTANYPNNYTDGCYCCLYTQITQNYTVRFETQPGDATYQAAGANCSQSDRLDFSDFGSNVLTLCGSLDLFDSLDYHQFIGPANIKTCFTSTPGDGNQVAKGFRVSVMRVN